MSKKIVLKELIAENTAFLKHLLDGLDPAGLSWTPPGSDNSIAALLWHVARACDVFLTQHVKNLPAEQEAWQQGGWAGKSGYDPRGIGTHGWGQLTGYSAEEVAAIPPMDAELLEGYFAQVMGEVSTYLDSVSDVELDGMALGYDGTQSNYFWVRHPLFDMTRHMGEMLLLKGMWERRN